MRRALAAATLTLAALTLTACGTGTGATTHPPASATPAATTPGSAGDTTDPQLGEMQQKVDAAQSAASAADSDAAQNN